MNSQFDPQMIVAVPMILNFKFPGSAWLMKAEDQ